MELAFNTNIGKRRQVNQDFLFATREKIGSLPNLFFVCDGMGGEKAGGYASKRASELIINYLENRKETDVNINLLSFALNIANLDLFNKQTTNRDYEGMGTTFVGGYINYEKLFVGNIGDSRCYHIRSLIKQVTHDHSLVEELVKRGEIKRNSKEYIERKNVITKALGVESKLRPDFFEVELMVGDFILFCSDGLTNMLSDNEIFDIVRSTKTIDEKVNWLIEEANRKGGRDNISIILIEIDKIERSGS
ncbi:MAG: Stp1/IreP family PP2C-type Ser/Thr phosphatase [Eubacteriales bacterium]|nr:Stp1/IreP family PP2C-type Ser/Thr phosphatase [Eubacteriales bacterium]